MRIGLGGFTQSYDEQTRGCESFRGMQKQSLVGFGLEFSGAEDEVRGFSDGFVRSQEGDFGLRILIFTCRGIGGEDGEEFGRSGSGGGEAEFSFHSCF